LGTINLKEDDILNITSQELSPQTLSQDQIKEQVSGMQSKLLTDPSFVSDVTAVAKTKKLFNC